MKCLWDQSDRLEQIVNMHTLCAVDAVDAWLMLFGAILSKDPDPAAELLTPSLKDA